MINRKFSIIEGVWGNSVLMRPLFLEVKKFRNLRMEDLLTKGKQEDLLIYGGCINGKV